MFLLLIITTLFVKASAVEKFTFSDMIKEKETGISYRYVQKILDDLVENIPDIEKVKYSKILFDFLGRRTSSSYLDPPPFWNVDVALDQVTIARFECKTFWHAKECQMKSVNGEDFTGEVQLSIHDQGPRLNIYVQALYVADYKPFVSAKLILKLVKKMTDSYPDAMATLDDMSNVKILSLITTGKSYYEYMGFHYVDKDGTRIYAKRQNYQNANVKTSPFLACISNNLNERMRMGPSSFRIDRHLKERILEVLELEIELGNCHLKDFWKIYRNVMKKVDFYALQKKFGFNEELQRHAKTICFTRFFLECLQEQLGKKIRLGFNIYESMRYP